MAGSAEAGIVHLRIVAPAAVADRVVAELATHDAVFNLVRLAGGSVKPPGELIICDTAREEVSVLVEAMRRLGVPDDGSISIQQIDTVLSAAASRAAAAAAGSAADAVVWEEVQARTSESAELSVSFAAFMLLSTLLAAVAILTDSQILLIGAMVASPEFGAVAGLCVALVARHADAAWRSARALLVGFPVAIVVTIAMILVLRAADVAPGRVAAQNHPMTYFISHPNTFSVIVAVLAGIAGMLSLTTAKAGALLGVLISVTTIPAAANVGVAIAYGDWSEMGGALAQLGINLACLLVAGTATLALQRQGFARRLAQARRA